MPTKRQITAAAKAMFEEARLYDQFGNRRRYGPMHHEWTQGPVELRTAYRRVAERGLKAAETVAH